MKRLLVIEGLVLLLLVAGCAKRPTVKQLIDVVAYLKSLTARHGGHGHQPARSHEKMEMR
jgi:hypothetical protein